WRRGPPPTPPGAPDAPAAGAPGTSDGHYGGTRGPPGSGSDSPQATPHPEALLTSTNRPDECHQRPGRVHLAQPHGTLARELDQLGEEVGVAEPLGLPEHRVHRVRREAGHRVDLVDD